MKKVLFISIIILFFISIAWYFLYYTPCKGMITIHEIEKQQVFKIPISKEIQYPNTAIFEISGRLDDTAQLQGISLIPIEGAISKQFRTNQYSDI